MKNNSANFSLYIWFFSIWLTPVIGIWFASFNSNQDGWEVSFDSMLGLPCYFTLCTLPILALFVLGNGILYENLKKVWALRLVIYLFSMLIGLSILMWVIRLNGLLIQNTIYFIIIEILLITILVWTLDIERGVFVRKQKLPPSRPDILDDDLR